MREYQVRICERLRVKSPGPTRQKAKYSLRANDVRSGPDNGHGAITAASPFGANSSRLTSGYLIRMLPSGGRDIREQAANIVMAS